jgi:putative nucleotidyltransferase with HDIG domain
MAKWLLCGVFILIPVFSLLFKDKLLYIITSICSLLVNMVLIMLFLFESSNKTEHIINILDILAIYLIVVFLVYFISRDLVKQSQLETKHMQTILTLSKSVEAKDPYTRGHSDRVANIAQMIADRMQLVSSKDVYYSGLIHDVGKLAIPDMILTKEGPLTDDEYNLMKTHTTEGAKICSSLDIKEDMIKGVLHHHERWDGRGYPNGLKEEQIPLIGRILCAADTIDAMSSDRAYRNSLELAWIREELIKCRTTQFDPVIIDIVMDQWTQIEDYILKSKQHI